MGVFEDRIAFVEWKRSDDESGVVIVEKPVTFVQSVQITFSIDDMMMWLQQQDHSGTPYEIGVATIHFKSEADQDPLTIELSGQPGRSRQLALFDRLRELTGH